MVLRRRSEEILLYKIQVDSFATLGWCSGSFWMARYWPPSHFQQAPVECRTMDADAG